MTDSSVLSSFVEDSCEDPAQLQTLVEIDTFRGGKFRYFHQENIV